MRADPPKNDPRQKAGLAYAVARPDGQPVAGHNAAQSFGLPSLRLGVEHRLNEQHRVAVKLQQGVGQGRLSFAFGHMDVLQKERPHGGGLVGERSNQMKDELEGFGVGVD